ncbi:MAG: aldo/keto reductase [Planctomycetota bacterium]|nr:MAG: aldo/keto reductase [Planctomycetota bacterium]
MRTKRLGQTDLELTVIGLGTWAIGGPWEVGWGPQDDNESVSTIIEAIEAGINWIDTAAVYGCGHSEEIVSKVIKELGERPIIATKCGLLWDEKRRKVHCLDKASIKAECTASLKRLGVEVIDLYQMHKPIPDEKIEEAWEGMVELAEEGKVRYIGVSNFSVSQLERVRQIHPVASLQPPYSLIRRDVEDGLLGYCRDNNIGVVCYSPMQKGLLTGKFSAERVFNLAPDDHRRRDKNFLEPRLSINLELVEALKPIAQRNGKTLAQLAIAWVLSRREVTAAIVGARRPGQITETIAAADGALGIHDLAQIKTLLEQHKDRMQSISVPSYKKTGHKRAERISIKEYSRREAVKEASGAPERDK